MAPQGLDEEMQKQMREGGQVKLPKDARIMPCLLHLPLSPPPHLSCPPDMLPCKTAE